MVSRQRREDTCFYIRAPVIGPLALCIETSTYLPFQSTSGLSQRQRVPRHRGPEGVTAAGDKLSAATIETGLNYWSWLLCRNFSEEIAKPSTVPCYILITL